MFSQAQVNAIVNELTNQAARLTERTINLAIENAKLTEKLAEVQANFERVRADLEKHLPKPAEG